MFAQRIGPFRPSRRRLHRLTAFRLDAARGCQHPCERLWELWNSSHKLAHFATTSCRPARREEYVRRTFFQTRPGAAARHQKGERGSLVIPRGRPSPALGCERRAPSRYSFGAPCPSAPRLATGFRTTAASSLRGDLIPLSRAVGLIASPYGNGVGQDVSSRLKELSDAGNSVETFIDPSPISSGPSVHAIALMVTRKKHILASSSSEPILTRISDKTVVPSPGRE
jgi:hypothetical protein